MGENCDLWQYVRVWGNGFNRYLLTQSWVNLKVVGKER